MKTAVVFVFMSSPPEIHQRQTRHRVAVGVMGPSICSITVSAAFVEREISLDVIDIEPEPMEVGA